jgi:TPR repeat protein
MRLLMMNTASESSLSTAGDIYRTGLSLLADHQPARALEAFCRAAALGHPGAHAAAAAIYFEGAVAADGSVVDGDVARAYEMCVHYLEPSRLIVAFTSDGTGAARDQRWAARTASACCRAAIITE